MAEYSLKTFLSPALVRRLAGDIAPVYPAFPSRRFVRQASAGMAPFFYMPHLVIVAARGLDHVDLPMRAQHGDAAPSTSSRSSTPSSATSGLRCW